jgi:hypothetical protein
MILILKIGFRLMSKGTSEYPDLNDAFPAPTALPPTSASSEYPTLEEAYGGVPTDIQSLKDPDWISKYIYHPAIVGTGMSLGGGAAAALAIPGGPIASGIAGAAGASAMYGPSNDLANSIDAMRGMQSATPSQGMIGDLGTGAEVEAGGKVLGKAIETAAPAVKAGIIKSISAVFGPSEDAINAWLANPSLPNFPSVVDLARKLPQTLNNLKGMISQATEQASQLLSDSPEGAIPKSQLIGIINDQADTLITEGQVIGSANQAANSHLDALRNSLSDIPNSELPQTTVKSLIKAIDGNINFADKGASATNTVLANVRGGANQLLRSANPEYEQAMKEISGMMGTLEDTQKAFGITNEIGQGLQPTDKTITALNGINKATKSISQDTLGDLKDLTGDDYVSDVQNAKYAEEFKKGSTQGSRRVNLGAMVGAPVGAAIGAMTGYPTAGTMVGEALGAGGGALADKFGGPMAAVTSRLIQQLSQHMPTELATKIVASAFAPQNQLSGTQQSSQ